MNFIGDPTPRYMREREQSPFEHAQACPGAPCDCGAGSLADTEAILHTETAPLFPRPRMAYDDEGMATKGSDPTVALGLVMVGLLVVGLIVAAFVVANIGPPAEHHHPPCIGRPA